MPDESTPIALLIVHMQRAFAREDAAVDELADRIAGYVTAHRDRYDLIVAGRFRTRDGSNYERLIDDSMRGEDEVALVQQVDALPIDLVTTGDTYNAVTPDVLDRLRSAGVEQVHVVGIDTDQCVLASVFRLFDEGYEPFALIDLCHSTSGDTCQEAGVLALRRAIGEERVIASGALAAQRAVG